MVVATETIILAVTTMASAAKAYFEWKKARENEACLVQMAKGVEESRATLSPEQHDALKASIAKHAAEDINPAVSKKTSMFLQQYSIEE